MLKDRVKEAIEKGESSLSLTKEEKAQIQAEYFKKVEKQLGEIKKDQLRILSGKFNFVSG